MQQRREEMQKKCAADPKACEERKAQMQQRREEMQKKCAADPKACEERKAQMQQRRQGTPPPPAK
jgi:hypothetical protein